MQPLSIDIAAIEGAHKRIAQHIHRTPLLGSRLIDEITGATVTFKCENLQRTGAFKARGAFNAVLSLPRATAGQGVATHSSGNHAAALALAAASAGRPAHVVMPESTPAVKVAAVRGYGAEVIFCAPTLAAREAALAELVERTGVIFIPPYDHPDIIAGQGTCALEIAEQCETAPEVLITPVGGGGLLAGCAVAARALLPGTEIVGAEPS
ncbi:MAG: pyridoxal-phosphate dependent enzyme, partial [Halioglobus sp.]|nr:pyridoxal-phosphate dependent enzyme [Halioglobus sp.]